MKNKTPHRCHSCGKFFSKWDFKCPRCRVWNWTRETVTIYLMIAGLILAGAIIKP
jgi:predicted ATP-dependent serine protease